MHETEIMQSFAGPMAEFRAYKSAGAEGDAGDILAETIIAHTYTADHAVYSKLFDLVPACELLRLRNYSQDHPEENYPNLNTPAGQIVQKFHCAIHGLCLFRSTDEALKASFWSDWFAAELTQTKWFEFIGRLADRAQSFLDDNWQMVEVLGNHLFERQTMPGPEVHEFLGLHHKKSRGKTKVEMGTR